MLSLNFGKTRLICFKTRNSPSIDIQIKRKNRTMKSLNNTKYLEININATLRRKTHLDQLINTLSVACYTITVLKYLTYLKILVNVYYAYFHTLMNYGIYLWGNSLYSVHIFGLQKRKVLRIVTSTKNRDYCRNILKKLQILPLRSQYIYSLLIFVVNNMGECKVNSAIHSTITRQNMDLPLPSSKLSVYQRGTYHTGIRLLNNLPLQIKEIAHDVEHLKKRLEIFSLFRFVLHFG